MAITIAEIILMGGTTVTTVTAIDIANPGNSTAPTPAPNLLDRAFPVQRVQLQRDPAHEIRAGLRIVRIYGPTLS
jgi:hypothetical protein